MPRLWGKPCEVPYNEDFFSRDTQPSSSSTNTASKKIHTYPRNGNNPNYSQHSRGSAPSQYNGHRKTPRNRKRNNSFRHPLQSSSVNSYSDFNNDHSPNDRKGEGSSSNKQLNKEDDSGMGHMNQQSHSPDSNPSRHMYRPLYTGSHLGSAIRRSASRSDDQTFLDGTAASHHNDIDHLDYGTQQRSPISANKGASLPPESRLGEQSQFPSSSLSDNQSASPNPILHPHDYHQNLRTSQSQSSFGPFQTVRDINCSRQYQSKPAFSSTQSAEQSNYTEVYGYEDTGRPKGKISKTRRLSSSGIRALWASMNAPQAEEYEELQVATIDQVGRNTTFHDTSLREQDMEEMVDDVNQGEGQEQDQNQFWSPMPHMPPHIKETISMRNNAVEDSTNKDGTSLQPVQMVAGTLPTIITPSPSYSKTSSQSMDTMPHIVQQEEELNALNRLEEERIQFGAELEQKKKRKICIEVTIAKRERRTYCTVNTENANKEENDESFERDGLKYIYQKVPCNDPNLQEVGLSKCHACATISDEASCLFKDLRAYPSKSERVLVEDCIFEVRPETVQVPVLPNHEDLNRPMDFQSKVEIMFECAKGLLPIMQEAFLHAQQPNLLIRPRELEFRFTCDFCKTGLFASSYFCRRCGQEFCLPCRNDMIRIDSSRSSDNRTELFACQTQAESEGEIHKAQDMLPISRFTKEELKREVLAMEQVIQCSSLFGLASRNVPEESSMQQALNKSRDGNVRQQPFLIPSSATPLEGEEVVAQSSEAVIPSHKLIYFENKTLKESEFRPLWEEGIPIIVKNVNFGRKWDPKTLSKRYGKTECQVIRCDGQEQGEESEEDEDVSEGEMDVKTVDVSTFFSTFGKTWDWRSKKFGKGRWKLKDWPPAAEMKESFPEIYIDFNQSIPLPDLTRRDGCKNLSSLFAKNANPPDLGPKMYNAWPGEHRKGGDGTTKLHMDIADAVNVLLYAAKDKGIVDGEVPGAQWDIFRAEDSNAIRQFLREYCDANQDEDPIHSQNYFLDDDLMQKLYKVKGVYSWRTIQRPGEAVFVPAGCAHQVCNLTDCIKIAVDFLSPQHIERCFTITQEFRTVAGKHVESWKEDTLQLQSQLWYAWCTCQNLPVLD